MSRTRRLLALTTACALIGAACGNDSTADDSAGSSAPDTPSTEPSTQDDVDVTEDDPDVEETAGDETTETGDESTETSFDPARFEVDLTVCEDPERAAQLIDGPVTIGSSVPLSGGPAVLFAPFADGMRAYVDYYNAEFGGVNGHDIELIIKDDQYAADLTSANVEQLIYDEDVDILAGVLGSPNNLAIRDLANDMCVPQLWAATGDSDWGYIDEYPWTTGLLAAYEIESAIWADFVASELGEGSSLALFYVNNEFGQAYAASMTAMADDLGIDIVATEVIDPVSSGAPSSQMTNLVAADPDAILAVPLGAQCIAFMTELENAKAANSGFDPLVYMTATCADEIVFGAVQNGGAEGVYTSANIKDVTNPDVAANDDAVAAYLDAFAASGSNAAPGGLASMGWTAAELAVWSIEEAAAEGNLSREGIMNAARNIDYQAALLRDGLTFTMDANDGYIGEGAQIIQWQNGGFVDVGEVVDLEGTLGVGTPA